jgi:hypothetical protein
MQLTPFAEIDVDVEPTLDLGDTGLGVRRIVPFVGGSFRGSDGLAGSVAAGGVDWQRVRTDGVVEIEARYVLVTDSGVSIEVSSVGVRQASSEVLDRIAAGESVEPSEYYFRTHVRLYTSDPALRWVNDRLFVGSGERRPSHVRIKVFQIA